jgi:hypothetical protein
VTTPPPGEEVWTKSTVSPARKPPALLGKRNVQMLPIGHSFGGLITYRGMSSEFIGHAVAAHKDAFIGRTGGLVVIVNPAFEGARYEPLHLASERISTFKDTQLPAVIVAQSRADLPTRYVFPIARWFNTIFERIGMPEAQRDSAVLAIGHNDRYRTHKLMRCDPSDTECNKACPVPDDAKGLDEANQVIHAEAELMKKLGDRGILGDTVHLCGGIKLQRDRAYPSRQQDVETQRRNPFLVVWTDKDVMSGHNDIFSESFVSFFRQMYLSIAIARRSRGDAPACVR